MGSSVWLFIINEFRSLPVNDVVFNDCMVSSLLVMGKSTCSVHHKFWEVKKYIDLDMKKYYHEKCSVNLDYPFPFFNIGELNVSVALIHMFLCIVVLRWRLAVWVSPTSHLFLSRDACLLRHKCHNRHWRLLSI